jgi:trans-aconitate methyltransferase
MGQPSLLYLRRRSKVITFRDLRTLEDVSAWIVSLQTRWPERTEVIRHISDQLRALPFPAPHVMELGLGPGVLAERLLRDMPQLSYTGIDSSELLLTFAQTQLAPFGNRASLIRADLNGEEWLAQLPSEIQAIVSLQALHDLGDESHINRIYGLAKTYLVPGGLLLNADLIVPDNQAAPEHPGRLSIARHLELLQKHGYERVACTLERGGFGCCVAFAPAR